MPARGEELGTRRGVGVHASWVGTAEDIARSSSGLRQFFLVLRAFFLKEARSSSSSFKKEMRRHAEPALKPRRAA